MSDLYISQVKLPGSNDVYKLKDLDARELIAQLHNVEFHKVTNAADTPVGVEWKDGSTTITGTLTAANAQHQTIYLVPTAKKVTGTDIYQEYVAVNEGTTESQSWSWELLGDTEIDLNTELLSDNISLTKGSGDNVLGESTTFTANDSAVSFSGDTNDSFIRSYSGATSKLETATITGVDGEETFDVVASKNDSTIHNITLGTNTSASKIETESKTAVYFDLDNTSASKATAGTAVSLAKPASAATDVSYIGDANTSAVLVSASVTNEILTFGDANVSQGSVTGINGSQSITPYTFETVTVPVVGNYSNVAVASVKTNTDVAVPVVSSTADVAVSSITTASKTVAKKASSAITVATGSLKADDTTGATIMTGLGTANTATAITGLGTATAAAQTITVGTNDKIKVAKYDDLALNVNASAKVVK